MTCDLPLLKPKRFLVVVSLLLATLLNAPELRAERFDRIGQGVRNLAMGNVGVALSYDENALHYNPAGLVGVDEFWASLRLLADASDDLVNGYKEITEADTTSERITAALGKRMYERLFLDVNAVVPMQGVATVGISLSAEQYFFLRAQNPIKINLDLATRVDQINVIGAAFPLGRGHWVLGVASRQITRYGSLPETSISLETLVQSGNDSDALLDQFDGASKQSVGTGFDLGIHRRLESGDDFRFTIGLVAQNLGGVKWDSNRTLPEDIPEEISMGVSIQPGNDIFRFLAELDVRDLTLKKAEGKSLTKRIHAGVELGILPIDSGASFLAFRTGWNQGYASYGLEINPFVISRFLKIQIASYAEETGTDPGDGREFRRALEISFNI